MSQPREAMSILTERLLLRRTQPEDANLLYTLDLDPEVMRFISKGQPTPIEHIQNEIIPRWLAYQTQWPPRGYWMAHLRIDHAFAGWFHLRPDIVIPQEMELGYRLTRTMWGQGLATEGAQALIDKAFNEWGYTRVTARTLAINRASRRVMEKAGLRFEQEFIYSSDLLPGWTEVERQGVKYGKYQDVHNGKITCNTY